MAYTNLDTDLLRTFAVAVEAGNFGRAAALVGRTASAVSLQIDRLEELAGQKLFRRDGRSFALTSAGEQLLLYARRILAINDEAVSTLQIACKAETVRLGLPEDVACFWLPRVLKRFAAEMPGVTVEVRTDLGATLLGPSVGETWTWRWCSGTRIVPAHCASVSCLRHGWLLRI